MVTMTFDNSYARDLQGFYVPWQAEPAPAPRLLQVNRELAQELGFDVSSLSDETAAAIFSGNRLPDGASPLAQAYAGHQFGGFSPQLGDGRALLLGEVKGRDGMRRDIQLKGSGRTPFSRGGDGKAAVGPVLREYLIGEAMHALGIPTTRALAAVATGEDIVRESALPGAVLTRVAASHVRVGTFQFFAARGETDKVRQLADYVLARHYPERCNAAEPYLALFEAVLNRQAALIARWMLVGFVHGVMNTDNMTVSGETIDYGPCAFLDAYDPKGVFSSIDHHGRYAYANQPRIAQWNLTRFAEALLPLIDADADEAARRLTNVLGLFAPRYRANWLEGMRAKLGLGTAEDADGELADGLFAVMAAGQADFTLAFRRLSQLVLGDAEPARRLFADPAAFDAWTQRWQQRMAREAIVPAERAVAMNRVNPIYIPRNHKVEEALQAASAGGQMHQFEQLLTVLRCPFEERAGLEHYAMPAPASFGRYKTFCGT